jgi:hypothetical protein
MILYSEEPGQPLISKTVAATLDDDYTTPLRFITHVLQIDICNRSASQRWVTIKLRNKSLFYQYPVLPNETISWNGLHALLAGDKIQLQAEVADSIDVLITGLQKRVST